MSYSGEWIYSQRTNLRKNSMTASEVLRKSLSPTVSVQSMIYVLFFFNKIIFFVFNRSKWYIKFGY